MLLLVASALVRLAQITLADIGTYLVLVSTKMTCQADCGYMHTTMRDCKRAPCAGPTAHSGNMQVIYRYKQAAAS